jgi:pyruvate dehydrogenase E1 component
VTSSGLLCDRAGSGRPLRPQADAEPWVLERCLPGLSIAPLVTGLDGHPHTLAFLAGINQVRATHLT